MNKSSILLALALTLPATRLGAQGTTKKGQRGSLLSDKWVKTAGAIATIVTVAALYKALQRASPSSSPKNTLCSIGGKHNCPDFCGTVGMHKIVNGVQTFLEFTNN